MKRDELTSRIAGISDAAVRKATGRGWAEWLRILDRAGARKMTHRDIAAWLAREKSVGPWWAQMLTVGYEQARGLRAPHQRARGFAVSVRRTITAPRSRVFALWADDDRRASWFPTAGGAVRKSSRNKSLRLDWHDGKTLVEARFASKDRGRTQVTVEHSRLASSSEVERMRALWKRALLRLAASLNGSPAKSAGQPTPR